MKTKLTDEQAQSILDALNEAVESGPWMASNFLRIIGNKLQVIRDDFAQKVTSSEFTNKNITQVISTSIGQDIEKIEVYIAIYSSKGADISSWESIIKSLPQHLITRPIYADEKDVRDRLRNSANQVNEAYVSVLIPASAVIKLPQEKARKDKLGMNLLTVRDNAINVNEITRFDHLSGRYDISNGRLVKNHS